jgi:putative methyltransferase (TIGR04325 family)
MGIQPFLRSLCPPALAGWARRLFPVSETTAQTEHRFDGPYPTWRDAAAASTGYHADAIFEATRAATLKVRSGEAVFERDSVLFDRPEYPMFLLTGLLHVAAVREGRLSILDFGGALGSSYYQCRPFTSAISNLQWGVVEQQHYVNYGRAELETNALHFYSTIEECVRVQRPNVAVLSGVLQCIEKPYAIIDEIIARDFDYVIVDRQPLLSGEEERICVSKIPPKIYPASYPFWLLSEPRFRAAWSREYEVVAEAEGPPLNTVFGVVPRRQMLYARRH